jgi:predicted nuclease with TOPRIM domain
MNSKVRGRQDESREIEQQWRAQVHEVEMELRRCHGELKVKEDRIRNMEIEGRDLER